MTTLASQLTPNIQLNWPRIGALSGSLSLHLYILALLLTPAVAVQLLRPVPPDPVTVHLVEPEAIKPEPVLPKPSKRETHVPTPPRQAIVEHEPTLAVAPGPIAPPEPRNPEPPTAASGPETSADVAPTALTYGSPTRVAYPIEAARRREHGTVILRVLVGADGLPQIVEIETSSGWPRLDNAARDAVKHWSFHPGTRNGLAQSAWARVPVAFNLSEL